MNGACLECPCCWDDACNSSYESGCPVNDLGESLCPCTEIEVW